MTTKFEFFEGAASERRGPEITVRRSGQLVLTASAVELLGEGVSHVQIGYDAKTRAVAIRAAAEGAKGRYLLREQKGSASYLLDGRRTFRHFGLSVEKSTRFDVEQFGDGLIGFTLPAPVEAEEPKPTKKRKSRAAA